MAMIDGLPPADLPPFGGRERGLYVKYGYGMDSYALRKKNLKVPLPDSTVCEKAGKRGLNQIKICILNTTTSEFKIIDCKSAKP
jgi:hypothetical protein